MLGITLKRPLAALAVTAGLLAAAAGPASASQSQPPITPPHPTFGDTPGLGGADMASSMPSHTESTAPASFQLVIDGVDCGWSSPTLSGIPANRGLPVTVPKLDGSSKDA